MSRILFRMNSIRLTQYTRHAATAPTQRSVTYMVTLSWVIYCSEWTVHDSHNTQDMLPQHQLNAQWLTSLRWVESYTVQHEEYTTHTIHKTCCHSTKSTLSDLHRYVELSHILFRMKSIRLTQYTRHAATAPTQRNDVNHWVFLNYNFSKEQCMLPEDDRMIETCKSVSIILMCILDH